MDSYKEFVDHAIEMYRSLPYETSDLYMKYTVSIPVIAGGKPYSAKSNPAMDAKKYCEEIEEKTRIKFDLIISDTVIRSTSQSVKVYPAETLDGGVLAGKLFGSDDDKIAAFMNAYATHYIVIDVKGKKENINILFVNSGDLKVQVLLNAAEDSRGCISEFYASNTKEEALMATLHEIRAGRNSKIEVNIFHNENEKTYVASSYSGRADDNSNIRFNAVYCGGIATKARGSIVSDGIASRVDVTEIVFGSQTQAFDINTVITNAKPMSQSYLDSAALLDGTSKCMLKGFAKVADKTRGSNSKITEKGVLLSKDAHIDALPDLSIDYSNEVKAAHSASTSPIDPEILFYLTSRGIAEERAKKLYISAFIAKYVSSIENPFMREVAMSILLDKLDNPAYGVITEITPRNMWVTQRA